MSLLLLSFAAFFIFFSGLAGISNKKERVHKKNTRYIESKKKKEKKRESSKRLTVANTWKTLEWASSFHFHAYITPISMTHTHTHTHLMDTIFSLRSTNHDHIIDHGLSHSRSLETHRRDRGNRRGCEREA